MTNRERIEAYFDDQLSTTEKESLLREMESDQTLKTEFEFQQEVIEGIQAYRKQELINRLNKVEVASVGTSSLTKLIGLLGAAAIISGGLFWYFSNDTTTPISTTDIEIVEENEPQQESSRMNQPAENSQEIESSIKQEPLKEENLSEVVESAQSTTEQLNAPTADVNVPQMVEPEAEDIAAIAADHNAPSSLNSESLAVSSSADVEIKLDKSYNFHYQVINGDLTLYGAFNKSKFEVIELKTSLGLRLYLFYDNHYFELKDDSEEIRPLEAVNNQDIIAELDKRRQ